jgi:hypothetical protein
MNGTVRALVLAIVLALELAGSATAAAPRLIMVDGKSLDGRVLMQDHEDVFELYQEFFDGQPVDRSALRGRQSLRLGLFWDHSLWEPYVEQGRLHELRFEQANTVGRFYPAIDGQPALVDVPGHGHWPKMANGTALRILEAHGIPIRIPEGATGRLWIWAGVGLVCLTSLGLALLFSAKRSRRAGGAAGSHSHASSVDLVGRPLSH